MGGGVRGEDGDGDEGKWGCSKVKCCGGVVSNEFEGREG